jgi:aminopeptidase
MRRRFAVLVVIILFAITAFAQAVDKEALAQRIVTQSAGVKEGDLVFINGSVRDLEILENIAVNVRKLGADPLVAIDSDRMTRRMFIDVPVKYDAQFPKWFALLANSADVLISIDTGDQAGLLSDIPPERFQTRARAGSALGEVMRARHVRQVNLGNGMYPTAFLAQQFGISQDELSNLFWRGVNVDYGALSATGERLRHILAGGRELQINNPNGTNLRVRVEGRPVMVSDGTLSTESMARGEKTQVWLPAGEVFLVPVAGTAQGTIVVNRYYYQGKPIEALTLQVKDGRVTSMSAKSGLEPLRALYDSASSGKDLLDIVDFGINPNVTRPSGSQVQAWTPAGTVTVGIGNNTWAGGDNNTPFTLALFLPGSSVTLDGKPLVENGTARF